ncbi:hypothetical protein ACIGDI_26785 [Streptomyces sp. NPDC085900]|uniref:hypothetical protein n=1 Tax=Streptomyces sp. NPDC085900 TaxID=3365737 RepID=UPI0037D021E9
MSSSELTQRGYGRARTWRSRKSRWYVPVLVLTGLGAAVELALIVMAVATLIGPHRSLDFAGNRCATHGQACSILSGVLTPLLTLALASITYLFFRFRQVSGAYLKKAQEAPLDLVETAGGIFGRVVGRDQLCDVLMEDLRDSRFRRANVVVGGIGAGKTALLVLLTQRLAERKAVPVPLRLRGVGDDLDFRRLAFERFSREVQGHVRSEGEAEKVWRRLCQQGRIVVLADGLEDALMEDRHKDERDNVIRLAIRRANDERLPLIITSRPHDTLRGLDASVTDLEPLSEEAALAYISSGSAWEDRQRLDWIVEKAGIAEAPTYLQVARELHQEGLLERALTGQNEEGVETRGGDRAALRLHLFDTWLRALVTGRLRPRLPLGQDERGLALEYLSALACVGLASDSAEVRIADVVNEHDPQSSPYPEIVAELARRVQGSRLDIRLAAHWGSLMDLVDLGSNHVQFQHSVIQAHLGARFMNALIHRQMPENPMDVENHYFKKAMENPGRELLIALVLHSRTSDGSCPRAASPTADHTWCPVSASRDLLLSAACRAQWCGGDRPADDSTAAPHGVHPDGHPDGARPGQADPWCLFARTLHTKALQLYTAALEIDSVDAEPRQGEIAEKLRTSWPDLRARDPKSLSGAKTLLVSRLGEAMRSVDRRGTARPTYEELFRIGCLEPSYEVRVDIAQEIGAGGDSAFRDLEQRLGVLRSVGNPGDSGDPALARADRPNPVNDSLPAEGDTAILHRLELEEREEEERERRSQALCAWLMPLLVGSVTTRRHHDTPFEILADWVRRVGVPDDRGDGLDLALETALAQGFKYAANRRARHPHARPQAREYLSEQARDMLKRSRFWFTRLTLLQALTLWEMPEQGAVDAGLGQHGSEPAKQVRQWLALPDSTPQHPLVEAAAEMCVWALRTRQPERFLWIDEAGVSSHVGSQPADDGRTRKHQLWIPPSTGWSTLHPRAQQLLADVMLLLNLAERGDWPKDRLRRLRRTDRPDLPPCLTKDRRPLAPDRAPVRTAASHAGSNCRDDCAFELCPYPSSGRLDGHRPELSEAFCRAQFTLLARSRSRPRPEARWQRGTDLGELRRFWERMGKRAQDSYQGR